MRRSGRGTLSTAPLRAGLCQLFDVSLPCGSLCSPREAAFDARAVRFLQRPQLTLGHDSHRRQSQGSVLPPFKPENLAGVAFAERDLPTLSDYFELHSRIDGRSSCFHAIMLPCRHARGEGAKRHDLQFFASLDSSAFDSMARWMTKARIAAACFLSRFFAKETIPISFSLPPSTTS